MDVMGEHFDLFEPGPSYHGNGREMPEYVRPSIEPMFEPSPDPMARFYEEPRQHPRRVPSSSGTSGFPLRPGANPNAPMPGYYRNEDHLMNSPEANMLLGAMAHPGVRGGEGGTPMPTDPMDIVEGDFGDSEPDRSPRRYRDSMRRRR